MNFKIDIDRKAYTRQRNLCVSLIREEKKAYYGQRNYCVSLIRKEKKADYSNLNTHDIKNSKTLWNTAKPLFTENIQTKSELTLVIKRLHPKKVKRLLHWKG